MKLIEIPATKNQNIMETCCSPSGVLYVQEVNNAANDATGINDFLIKLY